MVMFPLIVRPLKMLVALALFFIAMPVYAWEYDSGWLNFQCISSHDMSWVPSCAVTEGPEGHSQGQWFRASVSTNLPFSRGDCAVTLRAVYGGNGRWEPNEDFIFTFKPGDANERRVTVYDRDNRTSPAIRKDVILPGRFVFTRGRNNFKLTGRGGGPWAKSVWFGDYHQLSWGGWDVQEAPGVRAMRVQCNNKDNPLSASLSANPSSGYTTLSSQLRVSVSGGNSNRKYYRYRCASGQGYSSWRTSSTYTCRYSSAGTHTATVQVRQSGSTTVSATTRITAQNRPRPLSASLSANPSSGTARFNTTLIVHTSDGNSNRKYYRFKCTNSSAYSPWQIYSNQYSCTYPTAGTYTAKAQVWQSGMATSIYPTTTVRVSAPRVPLSASLSANPSSGGTPLRTRVAISAHDGNDNTKYYRYRCANNRGYTLWNTSASIATCVYNSVGTYVITGQVWQSGMATATATATVRAVAQCGNGTVETGEQCDDGNRNDSDQCSNSCTLNRAQCGNGRVESWGGEQCDDGNGDYTDGCVAYCKSATCGDGYVRSGVEQCDDGNTRNGDGCSSACQIESVNGSCGSANGIAVCNAPTLNTCNSGTPSPATYNASVRKWEWYCGTTQCSARKRCAYSEIAP